MKKTLQLVRVEWGDAWTSSGWWKGETAPRCVPVDVVDVGYILDSNDNGILLAAKIAEYPGDVKFIPTGMIQKITKIKGHSVKYEFGKAQQ